MAANIRHLNLIVGQAGTVSAIAQTPEHPVALYVFAHGAGAGMAHPFMARVAEGLALRRIATLRYQFPYMENGLGRPDRPAVAHEAVHAAVAAALEIKPETPLFAGGKSFGGRMSSQAQALQPLTAVRGLIFLGFPLHQPDRPSSERADHLHAIKIPMLFVQGSKDKMADSDRVATLVRDLGAAATLHLVKDADHSFHVPKRSGRTDEDAMNEVLDAVATWISARL